LKIKTPFPLVSNTIDCGSVKSRLAAVAALKNLGYLILYSFG